MHSVKAITRLSQIAERVKGKSRKEKHPYLEEVISRYQRGLSLWEDRPLTPEEAASKRQGEIEHERGMANLAKRRENEQRRAS